MWQYSHKEGTKDNSDEIQCPQKPIERKFEKSNILDPTLFGTHTFNY